VAPTTGLTEAQVNTLIKVQTDRLQTLITQLQGAVALTGTGSPENVVAAPVGTLYRRTDGGPGTVLYVKENGASGPTGWGAK
jgi:hypothetical protein